jgi:hypothetical protein
MEHRGLKNVNNCLNTNIYSYLETSGGHSSNLYLNVVHFFNISFMKNTYCLFQIKFVTEYTNVQQVIITQILLKQFN